MIFHVRGWVRRRLAGRDQEAGFDTIGAAIVIPSILAVLMLVVAFARVSAAHQSVEAAAWFAARAASLERSAGAASAAAQSTASAQLSGDGVACSGHSTSVNPSGFSAPVGEPGVVRVTVTCTVPLGELGVPGLPGSKQFTADAVSSVDTFRERSS